MSAAEIKVFSPHLYNHPAGLQRQLSSQEALAEIVEWGASADTPATPSRYFSRWQIFWITVKYPFEQIASLFLKAMSSILTQLTLLKGARILSVLAKQMNRDWEQVGNQWRLIGQERYCSSPLLMPSYNVHQTDSWEVYMYGSIAQSFLIDKEVISMTSYAANYDLGIKKGFKVFYRHLEKCKSRFSRWNLCGYSPTSYTQNERARIEKIFAEKYTSSRVDSINFLKYMYPEKGIEGALDKLYDVLSQVDAYLSQHCREIKLFSEGQCRGASLWFINLYLKSSAKFRSPLQHLLAVSDQFKTGVPKQGAILQSLESGDMLLKLSKKRIKQSDISLYELDCNRDLALKKIEALKSGIYRVGVLNHSLVYVKVEGADYLWDPEVGLFETEDKKLLSYILDHYYKPGHRHSEIYFEKYDLLSSAHS